MGLVASLSGKLIPQSAPEWPASSMEPASAGHLTMLEEKRKY